MLDSTATTMGSGYGKLYKKKTFKLLISSLLIISCILYTLYNQRVTQTSIAEFPITTEEPIQKNEASRPQSQEENPKDVVFVPKNESEVSPKQQVETEDVEKSSTDEPPPLPTKHLDIGKITISFGEQEEVFDRAIRSHERHNKIMGYPQFVLREKIMQGLWSKHAYIFSVIAQELAKPETLRLKWVMWLDRDTVLMNPLLQLEDFLPPPGFEKIHLLATNDRHGLNNGAFILRVNDWALKLFSTALAFHYYVPEVTLKYSEQSAMEEVIKDPRFRDSVAMVPQHWFNSFDPPSSEKPKRYHATPGSLLMHFASNRDGLRPERMKNWMTVAEQQTSKWSVPLNKTFYPSQFEEYWRRRGKGENVTNTVLELELRPRE